MQQKVQSTKAVVEARLMTRRRSQRGATLLEAVAFLGIAAIVLIGAVALFSNAFHSARANQLTEEVTAIETAARNMYGRGAGMTANLTDSGIGGLAKANALPSTLQVKQTDGTVTDEWGGAVTLTQDTTNKNEVDISFANVPQAECIAALTAGGDWVSIDVGTTTGVTSPVSTSTATTDCTPADGTSQTMVWHFTG